MRFWTIVRRELAAYFNSPIAYVFLFVFLVLNGFLFMTQFFLAGNADMRPFFSMLPIVLCVFLPAISMRLWAEEKQGNTYEMLLTFPMRPHDLVIGKFAASLLFYLVALAATLPIPIMLAAVGSPDPGVILGGYLGAACAGSLFLAIGLFISGLCRDQIVAFIVSMMSCFLLYLLGIDFIASSIDGWLPGIGTILRDYVGMTRHFDSFQRGIVNGSDVLYFLVGTGIFLILNGFWIEGRLRPGQRRTFAMAMTIAVAIFFTANWLVSDLSVGRVDLTQGKIHTISPVTRTILRGLKAPVTLKYYVSPGEKMPTAFKTLERDVVDKLDELRLASRGNLNYKIFHMEAANIAQPDQEESLEVLLQRKGIRPFQVQSIDADELGVRLVYSSLAIAYKEKPEEILPQVLPITLNELEYQLISKIYRMTLPRAPAVAIVAPYKEVKMDEQIRRLLEQMGRTVPEAQIEDAYRLVPMALENAGYEVSRVSLTDEEPISEGTDTLVVIEPGGLNEDQRFIINEFLVSGGSVLLAAQRYLFEYVRTGAGDIQVRSEDQQPNVNDMLRPWGLGVERRILFDENQELLNISSGARMGPFQLSMPVKLPIQIRVDQQGMDQELSITSRLPSMLYLWGSALTMDEDKLETLGLVSHVLLRSSRDSGLSDATGELLSPRDVQLHNAQERGPFPLAVLVEGQFPNAFPSRSIEVSQQAPGKLILIGAVTPFRKDLFEREGHWRFLINAVDGLTLKEDLIQIRAKQSMNRSIERISTSSKAWWRFFSTLLLPIVFVCAGWVRILWRRRAKTQYLRSVAAA